VDMISEANVGVGIVGAEGVQAANASDYSIGRFKVCVCMCAGCCLCTCVWCPSLSYSLTLLHCPGPSRPCPAV
jgi:hypothetical protein